MDAAYLAEDSQRRIRSEYDSWQEGTMLNYREGRSELQRGTFVQSVQGSRVWGPPGLNK